MLRAMIQLAARAKQAASGDVPAAVAELRTLAEFPNPGERAYVIRCDTPGALAARALEVDETSRYGFSFRRPSGSQSAQMGPVIKRSSNAKTGVGPSASILARTLQHFMAIAASSEPVAPVYQAALDALGAGDVAQKTERLRATLLAIEENKTVFVALGDPPGNKPEYAAHLLSIVRAELYGIDDNAPAGPCPLCDKSARLGKSALRGAKVNFLNADNHGAFPGFNLERAGDRFAICAACADAIATCYIHLKSDLRAIIAGSPALVLPYLVLPGPAPASTAAAWDVVLKARAGKGTATIEGDLLDALAEERALASFHVLWASAGDSLDKVTGFITDVPCTRLGALSAHNKAANAWSGGVLPTRRIKDFDLRLSLVGELLKHPGGKRTERRNQERLATLRQHIARAVYLETPLDAAPLAAELRDIIADHLLDPSVDERFLGLNLTSEPKPPKKAGADLRPNAASWIRHVALLLHYLRALKVLPPMSTGDPYTPRSERLQRLLAPPSGVDNDAKMFAFLLGMLFGRLLAMQGAKGVNVRSNALTWLRRATLTGADLPGLYVRVREKLIEYEAERSPVVREVVLDVSELGKRLGTTLPLDADTTMYFLFLGQALAGEVFAKDDTAAPKEAE